MDHVMINIQEYLIDNRDRLKELIQEDVGKKERLVYLYGLFFDEILDEFNEHIQRKIINDISKDVGCDYYSVLAILEDIDIIDFLISEEYDSV